MDINRPFHDVPNYSEPNDTTGTQRRQAFAKQLYCLLVAIATKNGTTVNAAVAEQLAQYAVNVVDFRDADSVMTRFPYDPNFSPTNTPCSPGATNVVWGCERPEVIITETWAWHDRRTNDLTTPGGKVNDSMTPVVNRDPHFDQQRRPQGAFFVELYSPWGSTAREYDSAATATRTVAAPAGSANAADEFRADPLPTDIALNEDANGNGSLDAGEDTNGNGTLEDEAESFQTVAGVGGTVEIPVLTVGSLALRAAGGIDLGFGAIKVGIIDIDPAISGVLGMNILNSGWEMHALQLYLGMDSGPPGVFDRVDLDFRTAAATLQGEMRLTVNEQRLASAGWAVAAGSVLTLGDGVPETIATLANEGLVDVGASRVTVTSGLTAETVAAWIVAGRNGGTWDGAAGITSSSAAAAADRAVGWRDNGDGSFTIAFAAAGDLDLNGLFDFDDVLAVVSAGRYDTALPATWAQGDYDYNGVVDFDDVLAMVSAGLFYTGAYAATPLQLGPVSAVPEPATWIAAAFGAALAALTGRRAAARERAVNGQVGQGYFRKHRPSGA